MKKAIYTKFLTLCTIFLLFPSLMNAGDTKGVRGEISDINGNLLAMNQLGFSISIVSHLNTKSETGGVQTNLNKILNILVKKFSDLNVTTLRKVYKQGSSTSRNTYIKVVDFISYQEMMTTYPLLSTHDEIKIEAETKRYYPYGKYAAHIVGYTDYTNKTIGKRGLEHYYNKVLQGESTTKVVSSNKVVDAAQNITLNIDMELQQMIHKRFGRMVGVAVVMRTNGEILAAVSYPSYDPNILARGISSKELKVLKEDSGEPFVNRVIHRTYSPGSVINMGMALAFEKVKPNILDGEAHCSGYITIGNSNVKFKCWKHSGHGDVSVSQAIMQSCDVFFYKKSLAVGIDAISKHLKSFGFGVKTEVDLPYEYSGVNPNKTWKMKHFKKPWYVGETVLASIGQGYSMVTPLQVARYTALVATGNLVTPKIGRIVAGHRIDNEIKSIKFDKYINEIRKGMYDVCNTKGGTAYHLLHNLPIKVAGKIGVSQTVDYLESLDGSTKQDSVNYFDRSNIWFTSYAPYEDPKFIVTVLTEHSGEDENTSLTIASDIYKWLFTKGSFKN